MSARSWLQRVMGTFRHTQRPRAAVKPRQTGRLGVEVLEDRLVPTTWFVNQAATSAVINGGLSWQTALLNVQSALALAQPGDQIWVAEGTYTPTTGTDQTASFALKEGVALYGGFAGTEGELYQRVIAAHPTILSGILSTAGGNVVQSYHVVTSYKVDSTTILDGFTIDGGYADGADSSYDDDGGGMLSVDGSPTLANLTFSLNHAANAGGGMTNIGSSSSMTNLTFTDNSATYGGGMTNIEQQPGTLSLTLNNANFTSNSASNRLSGKACRP
jgi:hypothetical protein